MAISGSWRTASAACTVSDIASVSMSRKMESVRSLDSALSRRTSARTAAWNSLTSAPSTDLGDAPRIEPDAIRLSTVLEGRGIGVLRSLDRLPEASR